MSDYFRFSCPKCGQRLKAKPEAVGRQAHCKRCGAPFGIPNPAESKSDPPTPRTPEVSLAAAETDPAPMVLKDETSLNYDAVRPGQRTPSFATPHKGCGRALGLAGLTVVAACTVIGAASYSLGNIGAGARPWPAEPTAAPSNRSSDIPRQKPAARSVAPPRAKALSKGKPSPRAPTGGGRS